MHNDLRDVTAAVIIENSRLFIARRPPHDKLAGLWELPGGKVEIGESPQECLARELREELAMRIEAGEVIAEVIHEYGHGRFRLLALLTARLSSFELLAHDCCAWVARDEISRYRLAPADTALVQQLIGLGYWAG